MLERSSKLNQCARSTSIAAVAAYEAMHRCFKSRTGDGKRCLLEQGHVEFHKYE